MANTTQSETDQSFTALRCYGAAGKSPQDIVEELQRRLRMLLWQGLMRMSPDARRSLRDDIAELGVDPEVFSALENLGSAPSKMPIPAALFDKLAVPLGVSMTSALGAQDVDVALRDPATRSRLQASMVSSGFTLGHPAGEVPEDCQPLRLYVFLLARDEMDSLLAPSR